MKHILGILLFSLWAATGLCLADEPLVDLEGVPLVRQDDPQEQAGTLPFLLKSCVGLNSVHSHMGVQGGEPVLLLDADSDGDDEIFTTGNCYIKEQEVTEDGVTLIQDQLNFPKVFAPEPQGNGMALAGPFDLDGDGDQEIMVWGAHSAYRVWGFWVVDPRKLEIESHFTLTGLPERRPEDPWDGRYAVVGSLPGVLEQPGRQALVLSVNVGFDVHGRGMMAVDPFSGEVLWHFERGPKPEPAKTFVGDLTGDGRHEVVYLGSSPDNLEEGETIGGLADDHSRLFVLDDRGRELWSRRLEGRLSAGWMGVAELDDSRGLEIITLTRMVSEARGNLRVWSARGEKLGGCGFDQVALSFLLLTPESGPPVIMLSTRSGTIMQFVHDKDGLRPIRHCRLDSHSQITGSLPLSDRSDPVILVNNNAGTEYLMDQDLEVLAYREPDGNLDRHTRLETLRAHGRTFPFMIGLDPVGLEIIANPDALPANPVLRLIATAPPLAWVLIVLVLLTALSWWVLTRRHRRALEVRAVIPGDEGHLREARLHLLEDLELSGHGAMAPLRSLRRLLWLLDAVKTGIDFNQDLSARFREVWSDCHEVDLPRLLVILDRARAASLGHPSIDAATEALQKIQLRLADMKQRDFEVEVIKEAGAVLHTLGDTAETALQGLRREVADLFRSDLREILERVLRANEQDIKAACIAVQTGMMAQAAGGDQAAFGDPDGPVGCRIDPTELGFILDNLVGNAVRAMAGAPQRELRIAWLVTNGLVKVEVSDTGLGIAEEDREHLLTSPFTTREEGGGLGLFRSAQILRKYGGQLAVKSSKPGSGTTFQLLLPRAHA